MLLPLFGAMLIAGLLFGGAAIVSLRASGAQAGLARRLAGPPEIKVGHLLGDDPVPARTVRVSGRIRCRDPLVTPDGDRLVAFHRDVEILAGGRWRSLERLRESRSFELWDHDGSLTVDPAEAAEPLIAIPKVWHGSPDLLEEPHLSAMHRLVERVGPATRARAITRTISVTDRLLVLARPVRGSTGVGLEPPDGGFVITNLELGDAMRLLGGQHRLVAVAAIVGLALAIALVAIGGIGALITLVVGA